MDGVAPLKLKDNDSYGQIALLYQAAMKRRPIHRELSQSSHAHFLDTPPGSCWDFDVYTMPEPDADGNSTMFIGFERLTTTPFISFSPCKGAAAFVVALTQLEIYTDYLCPGVKLKNISGDFDSSWAINGTPGDTMPAEVRLFCASREGLSITPKAPYSPALNRAELPQQRLKVLIMANTVRARLSWKCIGDMARGAWFQLMHQRVPYAKEAVLRENTRVVALQLLYGIKKPRRFVASNMLGYPGQFGFALAEDGKTGRLKDKGELIYYVHPDMMGMGTHWVRWVASGRLGATRNVALTAAADVVPALLARPGYAHPHGILGRPPQTAYEQRVDHLIKNWTADDTQMKALRIDARTGLPTAVTTFVPMFDPLSRTVTVVEQSPAPPAIETLPATAATHAGTQLAPTEHHPLKRLPFRVLHSGRFELSPQVKAWFLQLPKTTAVSVDPTGKAPCSASYDRYTQYKHTRTIEELGRLSGKRRADVL